MNLTLTLRLGDKLEAKSAVADDDDDDDDRVGLICGRHVRPRKPIR